MALGDDSWRQQLGNHLSHFASHMHVALDSVGDFVHKVQQPVHLHSGLHSVFQRKSPAFRPVRSGTGSNLSKSNESNPITEVQGVGTASETDVPRNLTASDSSPSGFSASNSLPSTLTGSCSSSPPTSTVGSNQSSNVTASSSTLSNFTASDSSLRNTPHAYLDEIHSVNSKGEIILAHRDLTASDEGRSSGSDECTPGGKEKDRTKNSVSMLAIASLRNENAYRDKKRPGVIFGGDLVHKEGVESLVGHNSGRNSSTDENDYASTESADQESTIATAPVSLRSSPQVIDVVPKGKEPRCFQQSQANPGRKSSSEPASWQVRWRGRSTKPWLVSSSSTDEELEEANGWHTERERERTEREERREEREREERGEELESTSFARPSFNETEIPEFGDDSPNREEGFLKRGSGKWGSENERSGCLCCGSEHREDRNFAEKLIEREDVGIGPPGLRKQKTTEIVLALNDLRQKLTDMKNCLACRVEKCRDDILQRLPFAKHSFDRGFLLQGRAGTREQKKTNRGDIIRTPSEHEEWQSDASNSHGNGIDDGLDESETPMVIAWEVSGLRTGEKWPLEVQLQKPQRAERAPSSRRLQRTQKNSYGDKSFVDMIGSEQRSLNGEHVNGQNLGDGSRRWQGKRALVCRKTGGPPKGMMQKDSLTVNLRYDSQKRESETAVVFQDQKMRLEVGLGDILSFVRGRGSRQSPHLEVQLADLIWQQDLIMFSLLSLPNQALWYGYNHKRDSHVLRTMITSSKQKWRSEGIFVVRPAPCRRLGVGLMHWSFRFPNGHFMWTAADGASGSIYTMACGGLLQANGSCAKDFNLSYERKVGQYGTKIRPLITIPDGAVSMEILQPLAVDKKGIIFRPLCDARLVHTLNGRNKGLLAEVSVEPREKVRFGCGLSTGRSLMAFSTLSVGLSRRGQDSRGRFLEGSGMHIRVEAPPADLRRAAFTLELQTGIP